VERCGVGRERRHRGRGGNHYFPPESLRREHFTDSSARTLCPWKGLASYFTVSVNWRNPDAAWYYPRPTPLARRIRGRVAFWRGVRVQHRPDNGGPPER
jgi:uncharacterized protein (DUF427 family)